MLGPSPGLGSGRAGGGRRRHLLRGGGSLARGALVQHGLEPHRRRVARLPLLGQPGLPLLLGPAARTRPHARAFSQHARAVQDTNVPVPLGRTTRPCARTPTPTPNPTRETETEEARVRLRSFHAPFVLPLSGLGGRCFLGPPPLSPPELGPVWASECAPPVPQISN
jgi:hypothetical protein